MAFKQLYAYIYVYIRCEVIIWAKFGHFRCYYLGQVGVIIWAKLFLAYKNSGFKRFLAHTVIILCFFLCPIIWQLSKNSLFQKRVQKMCFSNFCVLSQFLENSLFLGLLKHYKNRGFSRFLCFFVFEREKRQEKNDNWNFWIWIFLSKNGRFVTHNFFPQKIGWNPYSYSVFGCAFSGPRCQKSNFWISCQKKENFDW